MAYKTLAGTTGIVPLCSSRVCGMSFSTLPVGAKLISSLGGTVWVGIDMGWAITVVSFNKGM